MGYYQHHIFVCTNERASGKKCCAQDNAELARDYLKKELKKRGIHGQGRFRVSGSGCLGRCSEGPVLVLYPEGVWYSYKTYNDLDEIIEQHFIKGIPVERLLLPTLGQDNPPESE